LNISAEQVALDRYQLIRPFLNEGVSLRLIARQRSISIRCLRYWVNCYRRSGLNGLTPKTRNDRGKRRAASDELVNLVQGLCLKNPPPSIRNVYRLVEQICQGNGWNCPSYDVVHDIASNIPPDLALLAHKGEKAYKQAYELIHRREAERANEVWQADHTPLDIVVLDEDGQPQRPVLTIVLDDYSRAVSGYYLAFEPPSSMRVALALRQAIWRKEDRSWSICGIPERLYTDRGSDFVSQHIEQVSIDLKFELNQTLPRQPQGKGKVERFFKTVNQMFLSTLPGYTFGASDPEAVLTLEELESKFKEWLLNEYMVREHSETRSSPRAKWECFDFVPRMPDSREMLNHLLLTVARSRRVQRDGIRFNGYRYFDVNLAGYVQEEVTIRYDPRDMAEIFIYANNEFVCRAICAELADRTVSLREIVKARNLRKLELKNQLRDFSAIVDQYKTSPRSPSKLESQLALAVVLPKIKIRRFACDD
jgi:putative transposase